MTIRQARTSDIDEILEIFRHAKEYMRQTGNPHQWVDDYPSKELLLNDIASKESYVYEKDNIILATMMFSTKKEPTYQKIDGQWLNDEPYGVIHRIATKANRKNIASKMFEWAFLQCPNIRIDTHHDNLPMLKLLSKHKFTRCGIITILNNEPRIAFQKSLLIEKEKQMICTLDIGNSNIHTIIYTQDKEMVLERRTPTLREPDERFYHEFFEELRNELNQKIDIVLIACVVPTILDTVMKSADSIYHCPVVSINPGNVDLIIHLDNPNELGADFIASAYGAINEYEMPVIIIDMGTASKISVVGDGHQFLGGVIQPGVAQQAKILNHNIPHLPKIELDVPNKIIGNNTIECIQSGILHGAFLGLIEMAKGIEKELNQPAKVILTGGYINLYPDLFGYEFNPYLINDGLYYLAKERLSI